MKKFIFLLFVGIAFFACSNDDDISSNDEQTSKGLVFEISAVNKLDDGLRAGQPIYSQEAVQNVTQVKVYAFKESGDDFLYEEEYDVSSWPLHTTSGQIIVPDDDMLSAGNYKFIAVGRAEGDNYTLTTMDSETKYEDLVAGIANVGNEYEIFAGNASGSIGTAGGIRVKIQMTRKVAGVMGYFKNIPASLDGSTVTYLRLSVSNTNKQVSLSTGEGDDPSPTVYNIIDIDLSGQGTTANGIYVGNDLPTGVLKLDNSQLSGSYIIPVDEITMTLGLYDADGDVLKEWVVLNNGSSTPFDILANNFYSIGTKKKLDSIDGGTGDPDDEDDAIDLLRNQEIEITISPDWEDIHNLTID